MKKLLFCILLISNISGCFGGNNVNQIIFPLSMGIEFENGVYKVLYQVIDPSMTSTIDLESNKDMVPVSIIKGEGRSLYEANQNLDHYGNKVISLNHIRSIIIKKSLIDNADIDFSKILLNYIGDPQFRKNAFIFVTDNDINNIFKTLQTSGLTPFYTLFNTPKYTAINHIIKPISLIETAINYIDNRKTTYLPLIELEFNEGGFEDEATTMLKIVLKGACFTNNNEKYDITCLNNSDIEGYKWFQNISNMVINTISNELDIKAKVNKTSSSFSYNNDFVKMVVNVDISILYDYSLVEIDQLSALFEEIIKDQIVTTYERAKWLNIDIYNVKDYVYRYHRQSYELKDSLDVDVVVNVNTKILYS